jgi:membrane fusion protein, multidrug efflux system
MKRIGTRGMLLALGFFLSACPAAQSERKAPPVPVTVAVAVKKTVPVQISAIGTVEASEAISLKGQITGQIRKILFTEGQDVRKGDLLVELDTRSAQAALEEALANLARDKAQAVHARAQAKRYAELVKKDYVAREQADQMIANAASSDAVVKADEAQVESCRVQLQYCSIRSPIAGRVGRKLLDEGNVVTANVTEIALINRIEPVNVSFSIPDRDLMQVKSAFASRKLMVTAAVQGAGSEPENGKLAFVDNAVDRSTGTITLKGTFANSGRRLWPGQYVDVALTLRSIPDAVVVPTAAVQQGPEGQYVFVVKKDGTAEMRPVVPGLALKDETEIEKGLSAGETVVTDGQLRIVAGARVAEKHEGKGRGPGAAP